MIKRSDNLKGKLSSKKEIDAFLSIKTYNPAELASINTNTTISGRFTVFAAEKEITCFKKYDKDKKNSNPSTNKILTKPLLNKKKILVQLTLRLKISYHIAVNHLTSETGRKAYLMSNLRPITKY